MDNAIEVDVEIVYRGYFSVTFDAGIEFRLTELWYVVLQNEL